MKNPINANIDLMDTIMDRAIEDTIDDTGMLAPIDLYPSDDDAFDLVTKNAENAGTDIFRNVFAKQRRDIRQMVEETYKDIHSAGIGSGDITFTPDDISDDDIDELVMLALDPANSIVAEEKEPAETPSTPVESVGGSNG
jgi:D-alanine-D-alanine ligase-like ATP-grasp enzyme